MSGHADREHALLSASGAERWLHCPPSARLEETLPERTSEYAEEGRLAHEIAELKLRKHYLEPMSLRTFNTRLNKLKKDPLYKEEMLAYTDEYLDYIKQITMVYAVPPFVAVEKRLDYSDYAPEGFGTGDCLVIGSDILHIVDFKYGQGKPVFAADNAQMKLYALGAVKGYSMFYNIKHVVLHIAQVRLNSFTQWETTVEALRAWGENIKPVAQQAWKGEGEYCAGEWCGFCRAKAQCRARAGAHTALEDFGLKLPPLLTDAEIGPILTRAQTLQKWVSALEDYALTAMLAGKQIPGWKAVEGRSNRTFTDVDAAFTKAKDYGIQEAMLYTRKPLSLTEVEKLMGKKDFSEHLSDYVHKPQGKPTLAPETDPRPVFSTAADDFNAPLESGVPGVTLVYDGQLSLI